MLMRSHCQLYLALTSTFLSPDARFLHPMRDLFSRRFLTKQSDLERKHLLLDFMYCFVVVVFFSNSFHRIESVWVSENRYYPFNRLDRIVPFVCLILHFHRRSGPFRHTNIDCIWSDMHSIQVRSQVSLDTIRDLHSKPIVVTHSSTFFISRRTRFHQSLFWIIIIISQDIIAGRLKVHFFSLKILN